MVAAEALRIGAYAASHRPSAFAASTCCCPAGCMRPAVGQPPHVLAIDLAPDAPGPPRRIALQKRLVVQCLADPVDPAPAEGHVQRLGVGDRRLAGALLVDPQPDFSLARMVRAHPCVERRFALERLDLLRVGNDRSHARPVSHTPGRGFAGSRPSRFGGAIRTTGGSRPGRAQCRLSPSRLAPFRSTRTREPANPRDFQAAHNRSTELENG